MTKPNLHPTADQKRRWEALVVLGCILGILGKHKCHGRLTIHHTHVGGSRPNRSPFRNHDKTICLCHRAHLGKDGIDGPGSMGTLPWEARYGSEDYFLEQTNLRLER